MATAYSLEPQYEYGPEFLSALEQVADRSYRHWMDASSKRDGYVAESWRNRAMQYLDIRTAAVGAQDGEDFCFDELDDYFATDFLLIRPEVEAVMRRVA